MMGIRSLKSRVCFKTREVNTALERNEPAPNKDGVKSSEAQFSDFGVPKSLKSAEKPPLGQRIHRAKTH